MILLFWFPHRESRKSHFNKGKTSFTWPSMIFIFCTLWFSSDQVSEILASEQRSSCMLSSQMTTMKIDLQSMLSRDENKSSTQSHEEDAIKPTKLTTAVQQRKLRMWTCDSNSSHFSVSKHEMSTRKSKRKQKQNKTAKKTWSSTLYIRLGFSTNMWCAMRWMQKWNYHMKIETWNPYMVNIIIYISYHRSESKTPIWYDVKGRCQIEHSGDDRNKKTPSILRTAYGCPQKFEIKNQGSRNIENHRFERLNLNRTTVWSLIGKVDLCLVWLRLSLSLSLTSTDDWIAIPKIRLHLKRMIRFWQEADPRWIDPDPISVSSVNTNCSTSLYLTSVLFVLWILHEELVNVNTFRLMPRNNIYFHGFWC